MSLKYSLSVYDPMFFLTAIIKKDVWLLKLIFGSFAHLKLSAEALILHLIISLRYTGDPSFQP